MSRFSRLLALLLFLWPGVGAEPALVAASDSSAADSVERFTVYASLREPYGSNGERLLAALQREGYEAGLHSEGIVWMSLDRAQIKKLFARVRLQTVAANARNRYVTEPTLEQSVVPKRWRRFLSLCLFRRTALRVSTKPSLGFVAAVAAAFSDLRIKRGTTISRIRPIESKKIPKNPKTPAKIHMPDESANWADSASPGR
ncbi:MAG: hypothetical protein IPN71_06360 [Fibrobacteres bacterium]|nr:hypothetical protein [Fibrobacterota bacterium]